MANRESQQPEILSPICEKCGDSHQIFLEHLDRQVMCTSCPTPCQNCRSGGIGPYCQSTPCPCNCHHQKKINRLPDNQLITRVRDHLWNRYQSDTTDGHQKTLAHGQIALALDWILTGSLASEPVHAALIRLASEDGLL